MLWRRLFLLMLVGLVLVMPLFASVQVMRAQDCSVDSDGDGWNDCIDQCDFDSAPNDPTGCPPVTPTTVPVNTAVPSNNGDRDGDGTPDGNDQCPDVGGPSWAGGCPADSTAAPQAATSIPLPALPNDSSCVGATQTAQAVNVRTNPSTSAALAGTLRSSSLYPLSLAVEVDGETWYALTEPAGFVADWVIRHNTCDQIRTLRLEPTRRDWTLVLMQEGRVPLDEDFNEGDDIEALAFTVMMDASRSAQADLQDTMNDVQRWQLSVQPGADVPTIVLAEPDCTGDDASSTDCVTLQVATIGRDTLQLSLLEPQLAEVEIVIKDILSEIQRQQQAEAAQQDAVQQTEEAAGNIIGNLEDAAEAQRQVAAAFGLPAPSGSPSAGVQTESWFAEPRLLSLSFQAVADGLIFDLAIGDPANVGDAVHAQIHVDTTNPDEVDPNALFEVRYGDSDP